MSEEAIVCTDESFVIEGLKELAPVLDGLRDQVRHAVRRGAQVGAVMGDVARQKRMELWVWLRSLNEDVREDVVRFAQQSHAKLMKDAELTNTSQLTFALADPQAFAQAGGVSRPVRQEHNAFSEFGQAVARASIRLTDFIEEYPVKKWSPETRMQLMEVLKPLAEPLQSLRWISVVDEMPDDDATVLVGSSAGKLEVMEAWHDAGGWKACAGDVRLHGVTHWMEMPEGPVG